MLCRIGNGWLAALHAGAYNGGNNDNCETDSPFRVATILSKRGQLAFVTETCNLHYIFIKLCVKSYNLCRKPAGYVIR